MSSMTFMSTFSTITFKRQNNSNTLAAGKKKNGAFLFKTTELQSRTDHGCFTSAIHCLLGKKRPELPRISGQRQRISMACVQFTIIMYVTRVHKWVNAACLQLRFQRDETMQSCQNIWKLVSLDKIIWLRMCPTSNLCDAAYCPDVFDISVAVFSLHMQ